MPSYSVLTSRDCAPSIGHFVYAGQLPIYGATVRKLKNAPAKTVCRANIRVCEASESMISPIREFYLAGWNGYVGCRTEEMEFGRKRVEGAAV